MGSNSTDRLSRAHWMLLLVLAGIQFTNVLDFVIMMPLAPQFDRAWKLSPSEFGFLVGSYGFAACISGLVSSWCIDRFDRRRALLFLYSGFIVSTVLCGMAGSYVQFLWARACAGLFGGILHGLVLSIVGDVIPEGRRGLATGVVLSAFSVASIFGIPMGLELAHHSPWGWRMPFLAIGAASVFLLLLGWWKVPRMRLHISHHLDRRKPWQITWDIARDVNHVQAFLLMAILVMTTFTVVPYLPRYLVGNVGMREDQLGWIYFFGGAATLLTMAPIGRLSDRYGKLTVFRILALLTVVPMYLASHLLPVPLWMILTVTTCLMAVTAGRMVPAMAMITAGASPVRRGGFMSIIGSVQTLAMGLASTLGGLLLGESPASETLTLSSQSAAHAPIEGYGAVGILSCLFSLASIYLAGRLRPATIQTVEEQAKAEAIDSIPPALEVV